LILRPLCLQLLDRRDDLASDCRAVGVIGRQEFVRAHGCLGTRIIAVPFHHQQAARQMSMSGIITSSQPLWWTKL